jgi:hypothetical protein
MVNLGAPYIAFHVRLLDEWICVRILPGAGVAASSVLAADTGPADAALVLDTMKGHGSVWAYKLPVAHGRPRSPRAEFDPPTTLEPTLDSPTLTKVTATMGARHAAPACANRAQEHIRAQRPVGDRGMLGSAAPHSPSSHHMRCPSLSVLFMVKPRLPMSPSLLLPPAPTLHLVGR